MSIDGPSTRLAFLLPSVKVKAPLLDERVSLYLFLADFIFSLVDPSRLKVLLHSTLVLLEVQLIATSRGPNAHGTALLSLSFYRYR